MSNECEKYARIRELIQTHPDLPSSSTQEALRWLDDIVPDNYQTFNPARWELEIE